VKTEATHQDYFDKMRAHTDHTKHPLRLGTIHSASVMAPDYIY
jgi:hypothetical protein